MHDGVCICVSAHDNLNTIAYICLLMFGDWCSYVDWREISDKFAYQEFKITGQG